MTELTFTVSIEDAVIRYLKSRLHATRWPDEETVDDWTQGVPWPTKTTRRLLGR